MNKNQAWPLGNRHPSEAKAGGLSGRTQRGGGAGRAGRGRPGPPPSFVGVVLTFSNVLGEKKRKDDEISRHTSSI